MATQSDVETVKNNLLKIQLICQESLEKINEAKTPEILSLLDKRNKEIKSCCSENELIISAHIAEYMSPLHKLKEITDQISENKNI